ncbi:hypothetical protein M422DRAFT_240978 [Sphaerobolus stellatus SS14]|nr:hypothetical protein M422DRAFT_240978 [Sphaerobolus stellatus SS14]
MYLQGTNEHFGRWDEIIRAGEVFADLVEGITRPTFLDSRDDPWAIADRIAWGEHPSDTVLHIRFIHDLLARINSSNSIDEPRQLIHGDLTGNVLLSDTEAQGPAVIDVSLYWGPRSFQTAIVVADALTWEEATTAWARKYLQTEAQRQAFLRALVFRIVSDFLRSPSDPISNNYQRCLVLINELMPL